ncbi:FISUMP domain-containing protein [Phnomibacter sp. MR]|uniref:FISUMP domain-containing protein n=1 Tax=Phnomibacter sp. MR TaxID=3042318 RepID=UPI003A80CA2B
MKQLIPLSFFLLVLHLGIGKKGAAQNVGIGTNSPNASAILDLSSTSRGLLLPRLTIHQRNAMQTPVAGMLIWNSTSNQLQIFQGQRWNGVSLTTADPGMITLPSCGTTAVWADKNLNVTSFNDGTPIPHLTGAAWDNATGPAWRHVNDDPANDSIFGKLYNAYAVQGYNAIRLAPAGYRVPNLNDIQNMMCSALPVLSLVDTGTVGWDGVVNIGATNATGLTIRAAGGYYYGNEVGSFNTFFGFKTAAYMYLNDMGLTSAGTPSGVAWFIQLGINSTTGTSQLFLGTNGCSLRDGYTVRCILNE